MSHFAVEGLRMFLPANDFEESFTVYQALGFAAERFTEGLALMKFGQHAFLLQRYDASGYSQHLMLQLVVDDLDTWWERVNGLALETTFEVQAPRAPAMQPWGSRVSYVFDPTGVLWHVVEAARK